MRLYLLVLLLFVEKCRPQFRYTETVEVSYQIAGIFEKDATTQQSAFNDSFNHVHLQEVRIKPIMLQPLRTDSYSVWRELCSMDGIRPVAVFGPQNPVSDGSTRDQCAIMNIPHIQATWQPNDPDLELNEQENEDEEEETEANNEEAEVETNAEGQEDEEEAQFKKISINFYPDSEEIALAYGKLLKYYKWGEFAALYEDTFGLLRVQKILAEVSVNSQIFMFKLDPEGDNRQIFKALNEYHISRFLLDCHSDRILQYLGEAENAQLVSEYQLDSLIMDDVANHLVKALDFEGLQDREQPPTFSCSEPEPWEHGATFQQKILQTKTYGATGNIEFDENGRRINYILYVNEIHVRDRQTIGRWESANGTEIIENLRNNNSVTSQQNGKEFRECTEDEKFEGFSVDLVKNIIRLLREEKYNYTYKFIYDPDMVYGIYDQEKKKWTGLVGYLLDKKADLAVCDLTITEERKKVVDFSVPFMSLGISILYTQDRKVKPGMFSFLNPYTFEVWMHTATAYCVVSIILFICARISPADWQNPEPCEKDPEELENIWTFKNCAWLTMGSIMTQGCDILPKAIGTRWVCGMWWFFAVIVCQTYIAQLSASMTSAMENEPINSVDDLAKQTKIRYGAINGGSTLEFLRYISIYSSKDKMFRHMYETMQANPAVLVTSNDIGENRVLKSKNKYAFFMESSTIEYKLKRNCDLKKVGGELDSKDYGIAMPANSPFRTDINRAILRLKELTTLDKIKNKWWHEKYGAKKCEPVTDENDTEGDLEMENLIGAFVVLVVGLVFCLFMAAIEFMNEVRNIVVTHKEVFIKELKASLNFFQMQKPVLRNPSRAPSLANTDSDERREKTARAIEHFMDLEKVVQ
ncbi:hypothetical protein HF086_000696 [Spodoptera exigua]|uniref:Uncharacterized protein n=1 Tax=Spodoptera exigua TaxID=7107 RepID=A0A922SB04_SPOEX|nr:hypothetical protein HF086_000696 [Spodoptera exigua]